MSDALGYGNLETRDRTLYPHVDLVRGWRSAQHHLTSTMALVARMVDTWQGSQGNRANLLLSPRFCSYLHSGRWDESRNPVWGQSQVGAQLSLILSVKMIGLNLLFVTTSGPKPIVQDLGGGYQGKVMKAAPAPPRRPMASRALSTDHTWWHLITLNWYMNLSYFFVSCAISHNSEQMTSSVGSLIGALKWRTNNKTGSQPTAPRNCLSIETVYA